MEEKSVINKLPVRFRKEVLQAGTAGLEEIRLRIGQVLELYYGDKKMQLTACSVTDADVRELLNYLTGYSLYAYEDEIRQGYFTIPGGHRVGVAGRISTAWTGAGRSAWTGGRESCAGRGAGSAAADGARQHITGIPDIGAVNIRIAHEHKGCAQSLMPYIYRYENYDNWKREKTFEGSGKENTYESGGQEKVCENRGLEYAVNKAELKYAFDSVSLDQVSDTEMPNITDIYNTLIVAPPGVGKTTYLRDCIRLLSEGDRPNAEPLKVSVVDERSEIAACCRGIPQNDVGPRTDVLDGCPKSQGMRMLLRSMSPQVIAVDELGGEEDFQSLYEVMHSGIRILGTIHAGSLEELYSKPYLESFLGKGRIERVILLQKAGRGERRAQVYDMQSGGQNLLQ